MTGFADLVQAALPAGRRLPDELRAALDHLEAVGARIDNEHGSFVRLYPGEPEDGQSGVYFAVPDPDHLRHYTGNPDATETSSVVPIARTGATAPTRPCGSTATGPATATSARAPGRAGWG
ncbi:hypothetical protein ACFJIY_24310 [Pimelobacter simplex]|uniref:hypothetical protein n=1 Tax=Nocardioides simplex TaxID=2045 RepID=UPI00366DA33F